MDDSEPLPKRIQQSYPAPEPTLPPPKRPKMGHHQASHGVTSRPRSQFQCQWPANELPVEIFEIITSYLPRAEIKTLRQVCREFDHKASARYFRNVVVPFRSELYGSLSRDENGDIQQHPVSLLSNAGNRIFESFGPHILRFALSLEIDEDALAHPPIKPSQEAVASFWGIYRWPHRTYNRYADLEGIEQTADETQAMKDVLRCLTKVRNLGLCCDAGLGFLIRPDTVARTTVVRQPVFASHDWPREGRACSDSEDHDEETVVTVADFNGERKLRRRDSLDSFGYKQSVLEKMVADAGYRGEQVQEAIDLLLQTEDQDVDRISLDGKPLAAELAAEARRLDMEQTVTSFWDRSRRLRSDDSDVPGDLSTPKSPPALTPNSLTKAQKELILELEWAHRAMIQSFVISTIDNAQAGCFNNLATLNIAKIPSSHVHILYNDDFWSGLPHLSNVSLGVIADWRRITKILPSHIEDQSVSPVQAVSKVYALLNDYIGKQPNIESLHFEWICGGEFAPSFAQRNRYIIPAPFLETPNGPHLEGLLELPFVKHFSLKNCWATPHALWQMIRQMALASLEKLDLESVSLSACYTPELQLPLQQHQPGQNGALADLFNGQLPQAGNTMGALGAANNANVLQAPSSGLQALGSNSAAAAVWQYWQPQPAGLAPPPPPPDSTPNTSLLAMPKWHFWSGFLEHFSPGRKVRRLRPSTSNYDRDIGDEGDAWKNELRNAGRLIPGAYNLLRDESRYSIKSISLKSCGRVAIDDSHIATRSIARASALHGSHFTSDAQAAIHKYMQQACDPMLGRVLASCEDQELCTLTEVFGLVHGWHGVYNEQTIANARADAIAMPGFARFSGVLDKSGTSRHFEDARAITFDPTGTGWFGTATMPSSANNLMDDSEDDDWEA